MGKIGGDETIFVLNEGAKRSIVSLCEHFAIRRAVQKEPIGAIDSATSKISQRVKSKAIELFLC